MILFIAIFISTISFLKPKYGVFALVGVLFLSAFWESEVGGFTLNRLIGIFCILGMFKDAFIGENIDYKIDNFDFLFLGYLITIGISLLINGFYFDTLGKVINPIMGFFLYKLIVINVKNMNDFKHLLLILLIIPMFYIPVVYDASINSDWYRGDLKDNANQVAEYLAMSCFACIAIIHYKKSKIINFLTITYISIGVLSIYLTGSRTLLISIPFTLILYLFIYDKKNNIAKPIFVTVGVTFILAVSYYFTSTFNIDAANRIMGFLLNFSQIDLLIETIKSEKRFILWEVGMTMFLDNPLFGVGFGGFREVRRSYGVIGSMAHNSYVDILSETGIIGFLFAFFMIYVVYKRMQNMKKFTTSIIDNNYINLFIIFFISFFAIWVSLHHKSISRSMFLVLGICNTLYYIAKDNYLANKNLIN